VRGRLFFQQGLALALMRLLGDVDFAAAEPIVIRTPAKTMTVLTP
jgi:hypothetical protein